MNKHIRYTLFLLTTLLLATTACRYPGTGTDPDRIVEKTAGLIADFTPPAGYEPEFGLHALGYTAVSFNAGADSHLYLVQSDAAAAEADLQGALDNMVPGYPDDSGKMVVVEQRPATIRNQEVTVTVSEVTWDNGTTMRQAVALFQGKEGPALLILQTPDDSWDGAAMESLLASIQ